MMTLPIWEAVVLGAGIYMIGGIVGFLTCAFFVGANMYKRR